MDQSRRSRPLLLFYLLVAYVFIQFLWWSYHLVQLNNEINELRSELITIKAKDTQEATRAQEELHKRLRKRWSMIVGEGAVFLALLVFGNIKIRNTFKKEAALASQQRNFLLSITHELKTPLASTRLQLETLLKRELDREKQKEILTNAINDTNRLNKLVENILMAASIDNSSYELHRETTDVSAFVESTVRSNLRWLQQKHVVNMSIEPNIQLAIDKMGFESILLNLLENAVKYSPPGTKIEVSLQKRSGKTILCVKDEGPGIAESERQIIFQKFYRTGNEDTRQTKGTGLGLYIVKNLVQKHGGTIIAKNNAPNGAVFEASFG